MIDKERLGETIEDRIDQLKERVNHGKETAQNFQITSLEMFLRQMGFDPSAIETITHFFKDVPDPEQVVDYLKKFYWEMDRVVNEKLSTAMDTILEPIFEKLDNRKGNQENLRETTRKNTQDGGRMTKAKEDGGEIGE